LNQSYPQDRYEIILVGCGSTDDTANRANIISKRLIANIEGKFRIIQKPNGGPASARNAGLHASDAEIVALSTPIVVAPVSDWLENMVTEC